MSNVISCVWLLANERLVIKWVIVNRNPLTNQQKKKKKIIKNQ